ncbi:STAS domain-containing protein [Actinoplanes sp. NPDC026619]|uniref:STAS domain-containing protein n=1 Tax=Actinoplanes sp. NPDC026619 TaxID=3155798 RepID=UPI003402E115
MESSIQRTRADDETATVTVHGEIDFANCDELAACMREAVEEWSPQLLRVDLHDATFIDSTGLGALIEGYKAAVGAESRFTVVNPTLAFRRVLDVTGLSDLFGLSVIEEQTLEQPETAQATGA